MCSALGWQGLRSSTKGFLDLVSDLECVLVFPEPHHGPACRLPDARRLCVPHNIFLELTAPEIAVCLGPTLVLGTSVPKATVHKNREHISGEEDIGGTP